MEAKEAAVVSNKLRDLWNHCRDMLGNEENSVLIDDAAIFILRLFLDQKIVMMKHTSRIKKIFGQVSNGLINKMCAV